MFCNQCGTEIINNAKFCTSCGASAIINSEPIKGSKINQWFSKIKLNKNQFSNDVERFKNLSPSNTSEFNKYFFGLFFVLNFLNMFDFILSPLSGYTLSQLLLLGIIVYIFFNIPFILAYFLKRKLVGVFFAGLNFALYFGLSIWDYYDRFIVGNEHYNRGEGMLVIATIAISWKLFDLIRKYPNLVGKA